MNRLTSHYGAVIEGDLDQPLVAEQPVAEIVYDQADVVILLRAMKGNKLDRLLRATALQASEIEQRGSLLLRLIWDQPLTLCANYGDMLMAISDGVLWIWQMMELITPINVNLRIRLWPLLRPCWRERMRDSTVA